jgi:hypothetical protein
MHSRIVHRAAYYGRPALVARYRPRTPVPVRVVALVQYFCALLILAAAGVAALVAHGVTRYAAVDRLPEPVRDGVAGGGPVIPVTLAVLGLIWLVIARGLGRRRQWARATVVILSVLGIAVAVFAGWLRRDPQILVGVLPPLVNLSLLDTWVARWWFRGDPTQAVRW